jgi:hypothetical protein
MTARKSKSAKKFDESILSKKHIRSAESLIIYIKLPKVVTSGGRHKISAMPCKQNINS